MEGVILTVTKLTGCVGAELQGVNLRSALPSEIVASIRHALDGNHMVAFRNQRISIPDQRALTAVFGRAVGLPYITPMAEDRKVIAVLKEAEEKNTGVFGGDWHSDFSFLENPPAGSVLSAKEVPEVGGDTLWANQIVAYTTLPEALKKIIDGRDAIHVGKPYGVKFAPPVAQRANASIRMRRGDPAADREVRHPAVITITATGERALFLNPIYTTRFAGMSVEDSAPILQEIYQHCTRPDFCCRWKWQAGDVVVWNNRTTLHYATNDYDGFRRLLYRTTFGGSPPVSRLAAEICPK